MNRKYYKCTISFPIMKSSKDLTIILQEDINLLADKKISIRKHILKIMMIVDGFDINNSKLNLKSFTKAVYIYLKS